MAEDIPLRNPHADRITVAAYTFDRSRLLQASIDHKVSIYNLDIDTGTSTLLDKFTAHDAAVRDAKWLHPSTGSHFVTIGHDCQMRIFTEDPNQAPNSGRRFRRICTIHSQKGLPFVSVDTKTLYGTTDTFIAAIDRQGLLSLYEPTNADEYNDWTLVDQFHVTVPSPSRGDLSSFHLAFDPNPVPLPYFKYVSDDKTQLSLAVTAMNDLKVYRSISEPQLVSQFQTAAGTSNHDSSAVITHRLVLLEALRILPLTSSSPKISTQDRKSHSSPPSHSHPSLQRCITWSKSNIRGTDTIASISVDGTIRVFEIDVQPTMADSPLAPVNNDGNGSRSPTKRESSKKHTPTPSNTTNTSTLTSALAATHHYHSQASQTAHSSSTTLSSASTNDTPRSAAPYLPYTHHATLVSLHTNIPVRNDPSNGSNAKHASTSTLTSPPMTQTQSQALTQNQTHCEGYALSFSPDGNTLLSGGADGSVKIWRRRLGDEDDDEDEEEQEHGNGAVKEKGISNTFELYAEQGGVGGEVSDWEEGIEE